MKNAYFLILLVLAQACARDKPLPPNTHLSQSSAESVFSIFQNTLTQPEAVIYAAADAVLRSGHSLDAARAERCWREENSRTTVRDTCALLWAGGGESNLVLEKALENGAANSRILAISAVLRKTPIQNLPISGLKQLLAQLRDESLWLKAKAVEAWIEKNSLSGITETEELLPEITATSDDGPRDVAASLRLLYRLRPGRWHALISEFCDLRARGEARLRCWRIIGALSEPDLSNTMAADLSVFLPTHKDSSWLLFQRSFPIFAQRIDQQFNQEKK